MPKFTVTLSARVFSRVSVQAGDHMDAARKARDQVLAMRPAVRWKRSTDDVEQMDFDVTGEDGAWEFIEDVDLDG
jgi:hypothetical protein